MVSRILGFIREMLFARLIGAGPVMDVFLTAFQFPNLFRRIFAEGAFNSAFVPLYSGKLEDGELTEAQEFARQVASVLFTAMLVFVIAAQIGMPWLMYVIGPGFVEDPGLFQRAVQLTQITMPYLLMMSLSAMFSGVLNAHGKFAVAAAAPVLLNLTLIGIMMFSDLRGAELTLLLSVGITASGFIQTAWIFAAMRHVGVRLSLRLAAPDAGRESPDPPRRAQAQSLRA